MRATAEQLEAVERFGNGNALKINAFAGTGKTTTLQLLAASTTKRGMYLAFNKSIANEAKTKFPRSVACSTVHSLAYRATPSEFKDGDKMTGTLNANAFAKHLDYTARHYNGVKLSARQRGHLAKATLQRFLHSDRPSITTSHVPLFDKLGSLANLREGDATEVRNEAVNGAQAIWARMSHARDSLPLGHDGYLKLWALGEPLLPADFILLDEAQDTNPVVLGVLARQRAQLVYVGDRHQQIYEWRGAVNAMEATQVDQTSYLTTSFRFGERIAEAASGVLRRLNENRSLTGNPARESFIGVDRSDAILARTNASVMASVLAELDAGSRPHIVGGTGELMRMLRGVQDLKQGIPSEVPEFFGFSAWNEVVEFAKEPAGEQLTTFVSLVENHGEEKLIVRLQQTATDESDAAIVISTAHKAKGREWDTVQLYDDFLPSRRTNEQTRKPEVDEAELRLFYVALTRARVAVEASPGSLAQFDVPTGPRYVSGKSIPAKVVPASIVSWPRQDATAAVPGRMAPTSAVAAYPPKAPATASLGKVSQSTPGKSLPPTLSSKRKTPARSQHQGAYGGREISRGWLLMIIVILVAMLLLK